MINKSLRYFGLKKCQCKLFVVGDACTSEKLQEIYILGPSKSILGTIIFIEVEQSINEENFSLYTQNDLNPCGILYLMKDEEILSVISWNSEGTGFQIHSITRFTENVLPTYFKHNNIASFVRQLNMYGFARLKDSEQHCYYHPDFQRDQPEKYKTIKRKSPTSKLQSEESEVISDKGSQVEGVKKINNGKSDLETLCRRLAMENEALKIQNENLHQKIQEYETLKENMNKFCMQRAMWVEKSRNGGSTQADNTSNPGDLNNKKKKTQSSSEDTGKKYSFVLVLQKPQKRENSPKQL